MYLYCRSVTIEKCRNKTFILGPVETVVYMSHCESVTLICLLDVPILQVCDDREV